MCSGHVSDIKRRVETRRIQATQTRGTFNGSADRRRENERENGKKKSEKKYDFCGGQLLAQRRARLRQVKRELARRLVGHDDDERLRLVLLAAALEQAAETGGGFLLLRLAVGNV